MKVLCAAFFYLHVPNEKLPKRLSYKKDVQKMLMKLTLLLCRYSCAKKLQSQTVNGEKLRKNYCTKYAE